MIDRLTGSKSGIALTVSLMVLLLIFGNQQNSYAQRFEGGILGGLNASQVRGDHYSGYNKPGILAGGWIQTDISNRFFLDAELKYSQKGSRKNPNPKKEDQEKYIMRLGYLDMPVYLGFRAEKIVSVFTGVSAGYLINAAEYDSEGELAEVDQRKFNTFDIQAFIGIRIELTERLGLDFRGAYSFLPTRDLPGDRVDYWWDDQYNNVLSTALYYRLDF